MRSVLVIVNPAAGGEPARLVDVLTTAATGVLDIEVIATTAGGDAERIARDRAATADRPDIVVAVGGDGTVREVASGLHRSGATDLPALLVAPGGTGNSSYLGLWHDQPWERTVDALVAGATQVRRIDLAAVEDLDRTMLLGAGSGLIAQGMLTAQTLDGSGRDRLLRATLMTLASFKPYPGRVVLDGEVLDESDTLLVNIGGNRYRAGRFELLPQSLLDDGLLDVCVLPGSVEPGELADVAMTGMIDKHPAVRYGRGRTVTVERTDGEPLVFEHDGDVMPRERTSYTVTARPGALPVVLPTPAPACLSFARH